MLFKSSSRYYTLVVSFIFLVIVFQITNDGMARSLFTIILAYNLIKTCGTTYLVKDNAISHRFLGIVVNEVEIDKIRKVQVVTVKEIGTIYFYFGKTSKAVKESGYYLIMQDNSICKINSDFRNGKILTLGRYIIEEYRKFSEETTKYRFGNDRFK